MFVHEKRYFSSSKLIHFRKKAMSENVFIINDFGDHVLVWINAFLIHTNTGVDPGF